MNRGLQQRRLGVKGLRLALSPACALLVLQAAAMAAQPAVPATRSPDSPSGSSNPVRKPRTNPFPPESSQAHGALDGELTPHVGDLIRVTRGDGHQEWVLYGPRLEEFLDFLRNKDEEGRGGDYSISTLSLEGSADDEKADLNARIEVQVEAENRAVPVPIGMQEGHFLLPGLRHQGAGEFSADPNVASPQGHLVHLRGRGLHVLTVPLRVKLGRQLNQRHLQLTVPPAAATAIRLRVPREHCTPRPGEGIAIVQPAPIPHGTQIEGVGLKGQFDLAWEIPPEESQARAVYDVVSKCTLSTDGTRIQAGVIQNVEVKQGTVRAVRVRMPAGFRTITGQQRDVADPRKYTAADIDANGFIQVDLKPAPSGRIELAWELAAPVLPNVPLVFSGFDVAGARSDVGDVAIAPSEGFHFDYRGGSNVRRVNVSAVGLGGGLAESAFTFAQPFRLELGFEQVRPRFSVDSSQFLLLSKPRAELTARFHFQVRQGVLREVALDWPDWKKQGWTLEQLPENAEVIDGDAKASKPADGPKFRLAGSRTGDFDLVLTATRLIPADGSTFPLSLPSVRAASQSPGLVVIADAENVKSELEAGSSAALRAAAPEGHDLATMPETFRALRRTVWRTVGTTRFLALSVAVQKQMIETESTAKIEIKQGRLQVTQRLSYNVSYERLREAVLITPKEMRRSDFTFYLDRGDSEDFETRPAWTSAEEESSGLARIAFPEPRIGRIEIFVRYSLALPDWSGPQTAPQIVVPFVRSRDARFKAMRVELRAQDDMDFEVVDDAWSLQMVSDGASTHAWTAAGERESIPLRLLRTSGAGPGLRISQALVRSDIDVSGSVRTVARYRMETSVPSLVVALPAGATEPHFWLDDIALKRERIHETRPGSGEFRLEINALSPNPHPLLRIDYFDASLSPCGFVALHALNAPAFAESTSIDAFFWEVAFPVDQFLFLDPVGFAREFEWRRHSTFWMRYPTARAVNFDSAFGERLDPLDGNGNVYSFRRLGNSPSIVVGSMSQPAILVLGAGLALITAFALSRIPSMRSALSLLVASFAVAVSCLWYSEAVRLLLQPAVLGLLLAAVAVLVDARVQRRRQPLLLPAASVADFAETAGSSSGIERALRLEMEKAQTSAERPPGSDLAPPLSSTIGGRT